MTKYKTPERMVNAVAEDRATRWLYKGGPWFAVVEQERQKAQHDCEAMIAWLVEYGHTLLNDVQLKSLHDEWEGDKDKSGKHFYRWVIRESLRRMFFEEEEEESAYRRVTKAMGAVTLSKDEGDRIIEYIKGAIHEGLSGIPINNEPFVPKPSTCAIGTNVYYSPKENDFPVVGFTEEEVPSKIADLIPKEGEQVGPFYYGITPQEIERTKKIAIEAFHRGRKVGKR